MSNTRALSPLPLGVVTALVFFVLLPIGATSTSTGKEVLVVNDTAQAVPVAVQGTANVSGTVGIAGTPTVQVGNAASQPLPVRDVDFAARHAVQVGGEVQLPANTLFGSNTLYTVPAGKRLVIEFVSASAVANNTGFLRLFTTLDSNTVEHTLAFPLADSPRVSEQVRIYADQLTEVIGYLQLSSVLATSSHALFTLSGYLVDMP